MFRNAHLATNTTSTGDVLHLLRVQSRVTFCRRGNDTPVSFGVLGNVVMRWNNNITDTAIPKMAYTATRVEVKCISSSWGFAQAPHTRKNKTLT